MAGATQAQLGKVDVGRYFSAAELDVQELAHLPGVGALCAMFLDPMREQFGTCTVHSGYRSKAKNAAVAGAPQSHHLYDERELSPAADVSFARGTPIQWAKFARELAFKYGRGGVGTYPTHVHVDLGRRRTW